MQTSNMKKNVIWNTIGVFTLSLTSFIYSLILVRLCDLSITGIWSYVFAIACTAATLAAFGGRTYQVTDAKNKISTYTYVSARYITVTIAFLLVLIFTIVKGFDLNKSIILILICVFKFFEEVSDVYYGILQKHDKLYIVGKSLFFKSLINMILFLLAIYFTKNLLFAVILIFINNFLFIYLYDRKEAIKLEKIEKITNNNFYKTYFKDNLIICLCLFLATYLVNCPKYVMEMFLSDEMQGIYNILVLPATAVTLIGSFIINPILVNISNYFSENKLKKIKTTANKIILVLMLFGLFGCIGGYLLGTPILKIIYAFDLNSYMKEFILIIIGCTFYTISSVLSMILITTRKLVSQLIFNVILGIISFGICVFFIKEYGVTGGAYSYILIMLVRFIGYTIFINMLGRCKYEKEKNITRISKQ